MPPKDTHGFSYIILPGKLPKSSPHTDLQNKVYETWKQTWGNIFTDVGNAKALLPDDFYRQDLIPVILHKNEIVAFHLYTLFNTDQNAVLDHRYFSIFDSQTLQTLTNNQRNYFMSMEFLTVNPEWRKSIKGLSFASVISSLGLRIMQQLGVHATIAPARKENKVNDLAYSFGATCLKADVHRGNLHCDLIAVMAENVKEPTDPQELQLLNYLWNHRQDTTHFTYENITTKAA